MKRLITYAFALSIGLVSCADNNKETTETTTETTADTSAAMEPTSTVTTTETTTPLPDSVMMKNWQEYMAPGDMHSMMASWAGKWKAKVISYHNPSAPPDTSEGVAVNKMVMGNRYMSSTHTGKMMGQPFEGISTMAYDNAKKTFINTWIDNMGTGIMTMEGPYDASSKTITLTGKCVDPSSGTGKEMNLRQVYRLIDDKNQAMEMYGPGPDGKEFKMMEVHSTRM